MQLNKHSKPKVELSEGHPFSASTLLNDEHANLRSRLCRAWTERGQEIKDKRQSLTTVIVL